jgi:hypothetical protein
MRTSGAITRFIRTQLCSQLVRRQRLLRLAVRGRGEDTAGYWSFLHRHRTRLQHNARMTQPLRGLDRLRDLDELLEQERRRGTRLYEPEEEQEQAKTEFDRETFPLVMVGLVSSWEWSSAGN